MERTAQATDSSTSILGAVVRELKIASMALFGGMLLRLLSCTWRWELRGVLKDFQIWNRPGPRILVFWHGQQLMMPSAFEHYNGRVNGIPMYSLVSRHSDGRIIARILRHFGILSVAGSSTRGAVSSSKQLLEKLAVGSDIGITPDGPRGPAEKMKLGAVRLASLSGGYIYPMAASAERKWRFGSWDRMMLPKPFSRVIINCPGEIQVPANATPEQLEEAGRSLETLLQKLTEEVNSRYD